ncbi:MAG: hypothetical protein M3O61_07320, partial [Gemmatimonadota bacterium]|nr:hypothetical protein [Gemmatimonadota bacterium]
MSTSPTGVRSLTLSSPLVTTAQWKRDADSLLTLLPDSTQAVIAHHEAARTRDSREYAAAVAEYNKRYVTRRPSRSPVNADSARKTRGRLVYQYMWGPNEFTPMGTLKHFDGTAWLRAVRVPTLFVAGEFDEATPASTEQFSKLVPGAEFKVIPESGHSTENDNPEVLLRTVREFLRRVESA